jgi:hypothetical protein
MDFAEKTPDSASDGGLSRKRNRRCGRRLTLARFLFYSNSDKFPSSFASMGPAAVGRGGGCGAKGAMARTEIRK